MTPRPSFILYDVVRRPSIRPATPGKSKAERRRILAASTYFGEAFDASEIQTAIETGKESVGMYGARLTADIGNQPWKYYARREVARTDADYDLALETIEREIWQLERAADAGKLYRNPDSCHVPGLCQFFGLCSNGVTPDDTRDAPPIGYRVRESLHPELDNSPRKEA